MYVLALLKSDFDHDRKANYNIWKGNHTKNLHQYIGIEQYSQHDDFNLKIRRTLQTFTDN